MNGRARERASVLAIGTELTTGQITNRNAAWISEKLVNLGANVVLHETVADDRQAILGALNRCLETSSIVIICGGLGPTTDDFTRDVVAEWLSRPLEFHEPSWIKIEERLTKFGVPIAPSNRKQALFPKDAQVLKNPQGTADGFSSIVESASATGRIWVLPGPPREIEAIWKENDLDSRIRAELPAETETLDLLTWDCLGKSEAELGELTETALEGSGLLTGYRFHRPYVEVKVWIPASRRAESSAWIDKLEAKIGPWVITRNGEDLAQIFLKRLERADEIDIVDACSGGHLIERIGSPLRRARDLARRITLANEWECPASPIEWVTQSLAQADSESLTLAIAGFSPNGEWAVGLRENDRILQEALTSPLRPSGHASKEIEFMERSRTYAVEMALKKWHDWLAQSAH